MFYVMLINEALLLSTHNYFPSIPKKLFTVKFVSGQLTLNTSTTKCSKMPHQSKVGQMAQLKKSFNFRLVEGQKTKQRAMCAGMKYSVHIYVCLSTLRPFQ